MEFCPGPIRVRVVVVLIGGSVMRTVVVVVTIDGEVPLVLSAEELGVLLAPADEPEVELAEGDGTPDAEPIALDVFEGEVLFGCAH